MGSNLGHRHHAALRGPPVRCNVELCPHRGDDGVVMCTRDKGPGNDTRRAVPVNGFFLSVYC